MNIRGVIPRALLILFGIAFQFYGLSAQVESVANASPDSVVAVTPAPSHSDHQISVSVPTERPNTPASNVFSCSAAEAGAYDKAVRAQLSVFYQTIRSLSSPDDKELLQAYDSMRDIEAQVQALNPPVCATSAQGTVLAFMNSYLEVAQMAVAHQRQSTGQMMTLRLTAGSMARQLDFFRKLSSLSN